MTKDIVAAIEKPRKLIVGISEIPEAVFPQAHILETAE